ncbi:MAG: YraN family protein [Blastocatellia bacterium]
MTEPDDIDQTAISSNRWWRFLPTRLAILFLRRGLFHFAEISLFSKRRGSRLPRPASRFPRGPILAQISPRQLGQHGEQLAAGYLVAQGYQIVASNFRGPIGRRPDGRAIEGEIDLIAYDLTLSPAVLVFLEVKTRRDDQLARPEAAVDQRKRLRIIRTARLYRRFLSLRDQPYRFDVVSLLLRPNSAPQLTHLKNFFSDFF